MVLGFNRRTNIKIIPYQDDHPISSSADLSSTTTSNIIQNVTINYSHDNLQVFKNNIELAIRIKPKDPKLKVHSILLKYKRQYQLLSSENFKEIIQKVLSNETKIMMKILATPADGDEMSKNLLKKKSIEKEAQTLKKKKSEELNNLSNSNIIESTNKVSRHPSFRHSSTLEQIPTSHHKKMTTPRRRSMTNFREEPPEIPIISTSSYPLSAIKYAPDGTKLAPNGGKLFRGGSNNIPKFDLPSSSSPPLPSSPSLPSSSLSQESNKENTTRSLTPIINDENNSIFESSTSPLVSKKRRIILKESSDNTPKNLLVARSENENTSNGFLEVKRRRVSC